MQPCVQKDADDVKHNTHLQIEDETATHNTLSIPPKSMRKLPDCSKLRIEKQLSTLAKDGVIFLKSPNNNNNNNNNDLQSNAIKLRHTLMKLVKKYNFIDKIPHPQFDLSVKHCYFFIYLHDT